MRRVVLLILVAAATLISGCRNSSGVRGYWSSRTPDVTDYPAAEDEFARFAELAVQAPEADAFAAVDQLLKKAARQDEVTFLVYSDLFIRAFSLPASPCYNAALFVHAADKILSHKGLDAYTAGELRRRRAFCLFNRVGERATLPVDIPLVQRTLFLVVDQDCPSCRTAMEGFPDWPGTWRVALCHGHGPLPEVPGWDCFPLSADQEILDVREGPFYFVTSEDGIIEISYTCL